MFHINEMTYRIAGRTLFDRATVAVSAGHRVGLVGRNGTGKTTLFKLLRNEIAVDGGSISIPASVRVGDVAQEAPGGPMTPLEAVLAADHERTALLAEAETATDVGRIADIHARLVDIGAHAAPSRAATILHGLGFSTPDQGRALAEFSGGWRMRVGLAGALFAEPDLLLLDEPSNHLDIEAQLWLTDYLRTYPRTLVLISHDRELLNAVCTSIVHIDSGKLVSYAGNYDRFERTRREQAERLSSLQTRQIAERKRIQDFVDRFKAKASKARQAQSRVKLLEKMQPIVPIAEERAVEFSFPQPQPLSPPIVSMEKASVGYEPGKPILRGLDLRIDMDDRIALLGQNGNGKSTLIRLLADRLKPMEGSVRKSSKLRVGYFSQQQEDELDFDSTAYEHMKRALPGALPVKIRAQLGRFMFSGDRADQPIRSLSGGEKTRLLFALMTRDAPHILMLDEPTNHLDMDSRTALIEALNEYEGAVILVSHDSSLVRMVADQLWLVADGRCKPFDGDLDDYEKTLLAERRGGKRDKDKDKSSGKARDKEPVAAAPSPRAVATPVNASSSVPVDRGDRKRDDAATRQRLAPLRKAIERAEKAVAAAEAKRAAVAARLADPALYSGPVEVARKLQIEMAHVQRDVTDAEETWLAATDAYEQARSEVDSQAA